MTRNIQAFASAFGQQDNLGDAILRRHMLNVLRKDCGLHIYTGTCSESYIEALDLSPEDTAYDSVQAWLASLAAAAIRGRTVFAYNTGEVSINRRFAASRLMSLPLRALQAFRGGAIIHIGQGIKVKPQPLWKAIGGIGLQASSFVAWRDRRSNLFMDAGLTAPDWAFVELHERGFSNIAGRRGFITLSLRGDRPYPDAAWLSTVKQYADNNGLKIAVATQVKRDSGHSTRLASDLNALLVDWTPSKSHADQEADLRSLYAESAVVVSDRLHVLVVSMAEGAVPVDASVKGNHKVRNTFAGAGLTINAYPRNFEAPTHGPSDGEHDKLLASRPALVKQVPQMMNAVEQLLSTLNSVVRTKTARTRNVTGWPK